MVDNFVNILKAILQMVSCMVYELKFISQDLTMPGVTMLDFNMLSFSGVEVPRYYHLPVSGIGTPAVPPGTSTPRSTDLCLWTACLTRPQAWKN